MKTSFHSANLPEVNLYDLITDLKSNGYDAIEINASKLPYADPHIAPDIEEHEINKLSQFIKDEKFNVSALCAHSNLVDPRLKKESVSYTKSCIDLAVKLNSDIVQGSSGVKPAGVSLEKAWETLEFNLNEILSCAEKNNIKFTFEPVIMMMINNTQSFLTIVNRLKSGKLYLNFDPSQLIVVDDSIREFVYKFKNEIMHVHIKDGKGTPDSFEFPPLGMGAVDFNEVFKALSDVGYDGFYSIEYEAHVFGYGAEFEEVVVDSIDFIKNINFR